MTIFEVTFLTFCDCNLFFNSFFTKNLALLLYLGIFFLNMSYTKRYS